MSGRGLFITFEGPEGGGKSTQAHLLAMRLGQLRIPVIHTREPGGTLLGETVRGILQQNTAGEPPVPRAELLLFLASRAQLVEQVIRPALEDGQWVIADRFMDSTFAYQGYGRGLDGRALHRLNAFATCGLEPDLTFLLDIPEEIGAKRLSFRQQATSTSPDRFEGEQHEFHRLVRLGFQKLAQHFPKRIKKIDAARPLEEVSQEIFALLEKHCGGFAR